MQHKVNMGCFGMKYEGFASFSWATSMSQLGHFTQWDKGLPESQHELSVHAEIRSQEMRSLPCAILQTDRFFKKNKKTTKSCFVNSLSFILLSQNQHLTTRTSPLLFLLFLLLLLLLLLFFLLLLLWLLLLPLLFSWPLNHPCEY